MDLEFKPPRITARGLALFGVDLITTLLRLRRDEVSHSAHLEQWLCTFSKRLKSLPSLATPPYDFSFGDLDVGDPSCGLWKQFRSIFRELHYQIPAPIDVDNLWLGPRRSLVLLIYRQRACVFFDDARYYPHQSTSFHFPTEKQLMKQKQLVEWESLDPKGVASLRTSQAWHDGDDKARFNKKESKDCETFSFRDEDASYDLRFFEAFSTDEVSIFSDLGVKK